MNGLTCAVMALGATLFTWLVTAAGAGLAFCFRTPHRRLLDGLLGFAAGVMTAASFWSLLAPAIELAEVQGQSPWLIPALGFLLGGLSLRAGDRFFAGKEPGGLGRSRLLVLSVTLHNIPEGLAIGVAFGALAQGIGTVQEACLLALGIGLQNFPEGTAVALPLLREGASRRSAFFWGQLSGLAEPIAGVLGALLAVQMGTVLPFALAFAAGAMLYVVAEELLPETSGCGLWTLAGFALMMILDVALG
jgi:ZIP family zinc transporter